MNLIQCTFVVYIYNTGYARSADASLRADEIYVPSIL